MYYVFNTHFMWMSLILAQCHGELAAAVFVFDVVISALINSTDTTMQFLLHSPIDALLAVEVSHKEYLLVFTSMCCNADFRHKTTVCKNIAQ